MFKTFQQSSERLPLVLAFNITLSQDINLCPLCRFFPLQLNISHPNLNVHPEVCPYLDHTVVAKSGRIIPSLLTSAISISVLQQILCLKPFFGSWAFAALNQLSGSISYVILSIICEPLQLTFTNSTTELKFDPHWSSLCLKPVLDG